MVADNLTIGKKTILASDVMITTENHSMDPESDIPYRSQPLKVGPVSIGEGCWIGEKAIILPNVKIGDRCVIAAGAVVNRDIPSFSLAVGVPARVIKRYSVENHSWNRID